MILAVTGGKGGIGKSTLAVELAAALDAVVVDADLGMADIPCPDSNIKSPNLHDVLAGRADPIAAVRTVRQKQAQEYNTHPRTIRILPCGRSLTGARAADITALESVLQRVERAYGDIVVDCPAGLRADAGVPLAVAETCVIIASPRAYALGDAVRVRALAREVNTGVISVIINRADDSSPTDAIAETLGAPTVGVPVDPRIKQTLETLHPLIQRVPTAPASRAVQRVVSKIKRVDI
ncbi:AAA family ATPase [Haloquadratum walsbyi]|jgi:septum site-determining protein MinD|uniref:ParA domain protein n=1 Tax=Haloquadratum walsbyi (strain DSM 16790 / HBSQ001) TaxID=362976 RepID=Q18E90_HALWD|nr:AAA family ATPase [Haloquadratum walsbyi]CAJ53743.1 ParA domain protein [Haloquadratum walsbyi DSM 16790]